MVYQLEHSENKQPLLTIMKNCTCNIQTFQAEKKTSMEIGMFNVFVQNIDCGYPLELRRGGSNEYPQFSTYDLGQK